ncbi:MAG: IPExxxVDY family protein [Bacteroidales bacterium]|nr:IPExxxVDY family protein [Bacteroidales bacterium]
MRGSQKVTRIRLPDDEQEEKFIFGLVSPEPDYKLSLLINRKLGISLKTTSAVEAEDEKGRTISFSRFSDTSGAPDQVFSLISNKSGSSFFLKKLKNVDFIFHYTDTFSTHDPSRISEMLKELDCVTAVFRLDAEQLKEKNLKYL